MGRKAVYMDPLKRSQASRVAAKFGGHKHLANLMGLYKSTVYRWEHPRERGGTGGLIPTRHWPLILRVARAHGVLLDPTDVDHRSTELPHPSAVESE